MQKQKVFGILIIFICVGLIFYPAKKRIEPIQAVSTSYEKESMNLLSELQAGHYETVENFFQQAHTQKKLYENGRNVPHSVFSHWYATNYYITPELLAHINAWITQYPDSPFAYLARAEFSYREGWKSRGEKWAYLTGQEQWRGYYEGLAKAHADLTGQVMPRNHSIPLAYERLIGIIGQTNGYFGIEPKTPDEENFLAEVVQAVAGDFIALQQQRHLVEMAKQNNVHDMLGIHYYLMYFGLAPRWGGSEEELLAYAREVTKDAPIDSALPILLLKAHDELARSLPHKEKIAYYAKPGVWEEVEWAFNRTISAYPKAAVWMVDFAEAAYDAGKYPLTQEYMNKAYYTDPAYSPTYLKIGAMYMDNASHYGVAEKTYKEFLALRSDNDEPYRQLAYIRIKQDKPDEAIAFADKGIAINPNRCILWAHRCLANMNKNEYQQALEDCTQAIVVDQSCGIAYKHRAKINTALGNQDAAVSDARMYDWTQGK